MTVAGPETLDTVWAVLTFGAGRNAALVLVGAGLLGLAAGLVGAFLLLRRQTMVCDAVAHATLPGVGLAFLAAAALGLDPRGIGGLLLGAALSAGFGLWAVGALTRHTRLAEDAAIAAVLSSMYGLGIVVLTLVQASADGRQAGLDGLLLGAAAGMSRGDATLLAVLAAGVALAALALRRDLILAAFDRGQAMALGVDVRRAEAGLMALVLAVTVLGLQVVGLILVLALVVIPPTTARLWTDRAETLVAASGALGATAAVIGVAVSAAIPDAPTGPVIVVAAAVIFLFSWAFAPRGGLLAGALAGLGLRNRIHRRQGLLALARGEPIYDPLTLALLRASGLLRGDGLPTPAGRAAAAKAVLDEARWDAVRADSALREAAERGAGPAAEPIEATFTPDELRLIDARLGGPRGDGPLGGAA